MGGYGLWQNIGVNFGSLCGVLQVSLEVTSVTTYRTRHLYDGVLLVLRGSARGFWFIDPLGLRPCGLCTVATRACHVNHAPPSYNYNMIRDPLVVGLQSAKMSEKLQLDSELTLKKAVTQVGQAEAIKQQQTLLRGEPGVQSHLPVGKYQ